MPGLERHHRLAGDRPTMEDARVTVVVASRNRRKELLRSLGHHRAPVVLVDNGSTDGTPDAVRRTHPHVEVVELGENRAAAGRTVGALRACTPFVAFADDDSWWAPGALRATADALEAAPRVALANVDTFVGDEELPDPFSAVLSASPLPHRDGTLPGPRILGFMACAVMLRRSAFLEAGGFDDVIRFPGEEERLAWDLTARGWALVYLAGPAVHHHPSPRRDAAERRQRGLARSRVLTAAMRLPWDAVAERVTAELRAGAPGRLGVLDAVARLPQAVWRRRLLPPDVLADIEMLNRVTPDGVREPTVP
ncbi:Glycosyltransferase, GT2 family [Promicromonospora umidemergens]|nr:glycosyltransferase [Promicromonospora umidemergens]MCP2284157.1 Glycosyltransferase, GT2 family [Promicromonospora umidemergens]